MVLFFFKFLSYNCAIINLSFKVKNVFIQLICLLQRLKKLQITNSNGKTNALSSEPPNENANVSLDYEEIVVTIRKSEKGFGFELRNGILIVKVLPSNYYFSNKIEILRI